jgi:hypothetical protein
MTLSSFKLSLYYKLYKTPLIKVKLKNRLRLVLKVYKTGNPNKAIKLNYNCMLNYG